MIDYVMLITYVTIATQILNRLVIYPKNVINKAVYRLLGKANLNNSYKFKIIPIGFTSSKK